MLVIRGEGLTIIIQDIILKPVGTVISPVDNIDEMPLGGKTAQIEVYPEYKEALLRIEMNSHLWILSWFHKATRDMLQAHPRGVNSDLPLYGVFSLRAFNRPNPVGLSLVKLEKIEANILYVRGLDAISGTPVLDIKPYIENDAIFSPLTPYFKGHDLEIRKNILFRQAYSHHQEECTDLHIAVRMASIAEEHLGKIHALDLLVKVSGSLCLGDCLQGITRARLSNPARFSFSSSQIFETTWTKAKQKLNIILKKPVEDLETIKTKDDAELFDISGENL